jgi:hypothetical protein
MPLKDTGGLGGMLDIAPPGSSAVSWRWRTFANVVTFHDRGMTWKILNRLLRPTFGGWLKTAGRRESLSPWKKSRAGSRQRSGLSLRIGKNKQAKSRGGSMAKSKPGRAKLDGKLAKFAKAIRAIAQQEIQKKDGDQASRSARLTSVARNYLALAGEFVDVAVVVGNAAERAVRNMPRNKLKKKIAAKK